MRKERVPVNNLNDPRKVIGGSYPEVRIYPFLFNIRKKVIDGHQVYA